MKNIIFILSLLLISAIIFNPVSSTSSQNEWYIQTSWDTSGLFDVYFSSDTVGWAVGVGTILHTSDGGNIWYEQDSPVFSNFYSVFFVNNYVGWASGSGGVIIHTEDGGNTWVEQNDGYSGSYIFNLFFLDENIGWAAGGKPNTFDSSARRTILRTTNGGDTWETVLHETYTSPLNSVYFTDINNGWVVGDYDQYSGSILYTEDGGNTWNTQDSGITHHLTDVHFTDVNNGWITSYFGNLLHTTDGGNTWMIENPGTPHSITGIHFIDSQNGWISGGNNTDAFIMHTTDGGDTWVSDILETSDLIYNLHLIDSTHGWAVGFNGNILSTIQTSNTPPYKPFNPNPIDGAFNVGLNPVLSVEVIDPNSNPIVVRFYNADNHELIGIDYTISNNNRAYIIWNDLSVNSIHSWYAIADDGIDVNQSEIWSFNTGQEQINNSEYSTLYVGWNMIGWYQDYETTASSLAENISGCLTVNYWDQINQTYKPYIVGGPPDFDFIITIGMGLFINVDIDSIWNGVG